jgi:autotransporter-associated beta strand protein
MNCRLSRVCGPQRASVRTAAVLTTTALVAVTTFVPDVVLAQDATWISNPGSGNWNDAANWSPASVPSGTATFSFSNQTAISFSSNTAVNSIQISPGAPNYVFNVLYPATVFIQGSGITGSSSAATFNLGHNTEIIFQNSSTAGSALFEVGDQANLRFRDSSTAGYANITNALGTLHFADSSSADHATIVNDGVAVTFQGTSTAGSANITNNSTLEFDDTSKAGTATIVNNGSLQFHVGSTADSANITNNGLMYFVQSSTAGNATIKNSGTIDFSLTTGPANDHNITAGSIAGNGSFFLGTNTLIVGGNNTSTEVQGTISDCGNGTQCFLFLNSGNPVLGGSLTKVGTGTLILSGINTYSGATTVNAGILDVGGSIATSAVTTVNSGGALTGSGTIGNTSIASGGTFAPGNGTPGTSMTVSGNLAFASGALYLVQLNPATASFATVAGSAALGNATVQANFATGSYIAKQYTILTASGGIAGTFGSVTNFNLPPTFGTSLSYDPNHVYLNLEFAISLLAGLNTNQRNVADALTRFFNANDGIPAVFASLSPTGLSQASGEIATGTQQATFDAMNLFMGLLTDPSVAGRGNGAGGAQAYADDSGTLAYTTRRTGDARDTLAQTPTKAVAASFDARWHVWGAAYGGTGNTSGNATLGSNNSNASAYGVVGGFDYRISPATMVGFALAGGGTAFNVNGSGNGRSDLFQAGAFVRHSFGAGYVTGALAYGGQQIFTDRTVTVAGFDHLRARFDANAWSGRLEGGYRYLTPWMGITPYAAAQFTTFDLPAYAEQVISGTGNFALNYAARDVTDSRSELGLRTDRSFGMTDGILTVRSRFAWAHDFNTDRTAAAVFQTLPGASFVVNGAAQAHDSALITAAADMKWMNGWSAVATFEGGFSNMMNSWAGKAMLRYAW